VGTVLHHQSKERLVRVGLVAFAVLLVGFALVRHPALAYPAVGVLGFAYFVVITALSTVLQSHLDNAIRGRVMALWIMGFGGTVPLGVFVGGWLVHVIGVTWVLLYGALVALFLAWYADLARANARSRALAEV
jgi:predicted MFS family arabinose efflux permease